MRRQKTLVCDSPPCLGQADVGQPVPQFALLSKVVARLSWCCGGD